MRKQILLLGSFVAASAAWQSSARAELGDFAESSAYACEWSSPGAPCVFDEDGVAYAGHCSEPGIHDGECGGRSGPDASIIILTCSICIADERDGGVSDADPGDSLDAGVDESDASVVDYDSGVFDANDVHHHDSGSSEAGIERDLGLPIDTQLAYAACNGEKDGVACVYENDTATQCFVGTCGAGYCSARPATHEECFGGGDDHGGGCSVPSTSSPSAPGLLAFAALALAVVRRLVK